MLKQPLGGKYVTSKYKIHYQAVLFPSSFAEWGFSCQLVLFHIQFVPDQEFAFFFSFVCFSDLF